MIRPVGVFSLCMSLLGPLAFSPFVASAIAASQLTDAAQQKDWAVVHGLIEQGADVNSAQGDGMTALHWAAWHGEADLVRLLIEVGANVGVATRINGYTPLFLASQHGHAAVIGALLEGGANLNLASTTGSTPLMFGAAAGQVDAVRLLLNAGADVNAVESAREQTALMFAAADNRGNTIKALAAGGADLAATTRVVELSAVRTPEEASQVPGVDRPYRYPELIRHLGGLTALLFAAREGHLESVMALLDAGADIHQLGAGHGTSALLMAIINGHYDLAKLLLDKGADPGQAADNGVTPLYAVLNSWWAQKTFHNQLRDRYQQHQNYLDLMKALFEKGADPNARLKRKVWYSEFNKDNSRMNEAGATPFWRAAYACDVDAMRLLLAHGADPHIPTVRQAQRSGSGDEVQAEDLSGLTPVPLGGPSVEPLVAAAGVGHGRGGGSSRHYHLAGCMPAVTYLVEELGADVNARDHRGNTALHYAAARGDNEMITYLVSKGADVRAVNRVGQTIADPANGPTERGVPPFTDTLALLAERGVLPNYKCVLCR